MPFIKTITIIAEKIPPPPPAPVVICEIQTSDINHTVAINSVGRVWAWGANNGGQVGDNSILNKLTPVSILGVTKTFCQIIVGTGHTAAIDKNGRAWAWGFNFSGQLGDNSTASRLTPVSIAGTVKTFCKIAAGSCHTIVIDKNGRAWAWGNNARGQLGDNSITSKITPVSILGTTKTFCQISAGALYTAAIDKNGIVWTWGDNGAGQLGDNSITSKRTPVSILGTTKTFCQISTGTCHTVAIDKNGRAWAWGQNNNGGRLGDNSTTNRATPVSVAGLVKTFCQIDAGLQHTVAIDKNGRAWAWGRNLEGQLGDNSTTSKITPVSIAGTVKTFCKIAAGSCHTAAIDKDGTAWMWGSNSLGQLGDNSASSRPDPISVAGTTKTFCRITAGFCHTAAIDKNGIVWTWGDNGVGQLGDNSITSRFTPVSILGTTKTFCQISAGFSHTVAIDKNGRVWAWGLNNFGQLGDNSNTSYRTPISILGTTKTFCQISAGRKYTVSIDKNGRVWAWGLNDFGQLGDNSITSKITPVSILGTTKTFCQISAGEYHSVGLDKNGRAWAWGLNNFGQLGDNTFISRMTPVSVAGTLKTFCNIVADYCHTVAVDNNGKVWGWGLNNKGQLGDNSQNRLTPIRVCNI